MQLRDPDDLVRLMRLKRLNDRTLGEAAQISYSRIYLLRTGARPRIHRDTALAIADALGVEVDELFRPMD